MLTHRYHAFVHFFFTYHQHVWHFHQFGIAYFLTYLLVAVIYLSSYTDFFQRSSYLLCISAIISWRNFINCSA